MKFDPILPETRVQAMRSQRYWGDELLLDHLDRSIAQAPDKTAIADFNSMQGAGRRLSYREFGDLVDRIASTRAAGSIGSNFMFPPRFSCLAGADPESAGSGVGVRMTA